MSGDVFAEYTTGTTNGTGFSQIANRYLVEPNYATPDNLIQYAARVSNLDDVADLFASVARMVRDLKDETKYLNSRNDELMTEVRTLKIANQGPQGKQGLVGEKGDAGPTGQPGQDGLDARDDADLTARIVEMEEKLKDFKDQMEEVQEALDDLD